MRCRSILTAYPQNAEGYDLAVAWCDGLDDSRSRPAADQGALLLTQAKQAIADEDYVTASERCFALLPHPWAYSALLRCAVEAEWTELTQQVLEAFESAPDTVLAGLTEKDRNRLDTLRGGSSLASIGPTSGWVAWAEGVLANPSNAPSVADLQEMSTKWSPEEYAKDTARCEALAGLLSKASGDAEDVFRDAFPALVEFFDGTVGSRRAFKAIYSILIKSLGWTGVLSSDELEIGAQLLHAILATGPGSEEYADVVGDLQEVLKANASPVHFDWGLNLAEDLIHYPAPDRGAARLRLFLDVVGMLRTAPHRVTIPQRDILTCLAADYSCPELLESFPSTPTNSVEHLRQE